MISTIGRSSPTSMGKKPVTRVPEERAATPSEVDEAIAALSDADWLRLENFADVQVLPLKRRVPECLGKELLNEAFKRLLARSRKWDKTKDGFTEFLFSTMESIANSWTRHTFTKKGKTILFSTLVSETEEGDTTSPVDNLDAGDIDAGQMLIFREALVQIETLMETEDNDVRSLFEGMRESLTPPEIRDLWGWSQEKYNAVAVKMRRHLKKAGIFDPTKETHHVH